MDPRRRILYKRRLTIALTTRAWQAQEFPPRSSGAVEIQRRDPSIRRRTAVTVTVVLMMLAVAEPANAAFPGSDGRISYGVWSNQKRVKHEVFTVRPDGTGHRRLKLTPAA